MTAKHPRYDDGTPILIGDTVTCKGLVHLAYTVDAVRHHAIDILATIDGTCRYVVQASDLERYTPPVTVTIEVPADVARDVLNAHVAYGGDWDVLAGGTHDLILDLVHDALVSKEVAT